MLTDSLLFVFKQPMEQIVMQFSDSTNLKPEFARFVLSTFPISSIELEVNVLLTFCSSNQTMLRAKWLEPRASVSNIQTSKGNEMNTTKKS